MRALCRAFDWASSPLGPVETWSPSLCVLVSTLLGSRHPMFLWWGPELIQFYNDAYRPSFGVEGRHPRALGMRGAECWTDIWDVIGPQIDQVMTTGVPTWHEDQQLMIDRNGRLEPAWWTYSYSPAFDVDGTIGGTLVVCTETTSRVLAELRAQALVDETAQAHRRVTGLQTLTIALAAASSEADVTRVIVEQSFALLNATGTLVARRATNDTQVMILGASHLSEELLHKWRYIPLDAPVPVADVVRSGTPVFLESRDAWRARYPHLLSEVEAAGHEANLVVPLLVNGIAIGAIGAAYAERRTFTEEDRVVAMTLANQCAQALERVRLFDAERQARSETESARGWLTRVLEQAPLVINTFKGPAHVFESANAFFRRVTGKSVDIIGRTVREAQPELESTGFYELLDHVYVTGEPFIGTEMPVPVDMDGDGVPETRYFNVVYHPVRDAANAVEGIASVAADVTDLVRSRQLAEAARRDAEHANRAKSDFLAVMSHELRTPLNAIGGYADLIALGIRGPVTEAQQHDLSRLTRSQQHLLGLINEVLNFAKLETGSVDFTMTDVVVRDVLNETEALILPQAATKQLRLFVVPCEPEWRARADAEKARQILANLLSNAVKFTDAHGSITLECVGAPAHIDLIVRDTGIGIPPDKLDAIFEPFVQIRSDLTRPQDGTGLGLAISRDLARGMHGELTVTSALGQGSAFTLRLQRSS